MAGPNTGAELLEELRPELLKAFRDIPSHGMLGFRVHFVDGQVSRIEYEASLARRLTPRSGRA